MLGRETMVTMSSEKPSESTERVASDASWQAEEHPHEPTAHERIVVGVDGSSSSRQALLWAIHQAARCTSVLRIVSVLVPPDMGLESYEYGPPDRELETKALERARTWIQEAEEQARRALPGDQISAEVRVGGAAQILIEESRNADLVVVGSRGLGGFRGLLLGSVSQQCAAHAACPVVVVRGDHRVLQA